MSHNRSLDTKRILTKGSSESDFLLKIEISNKFYLEIELHIILISIKIKLYFFIHHAYLLRLEVQSNVEF